MNREQSRVLKSVLGTVGLVVLLVGISYWWNLQPESAEPSRQVDAGRGAVVAMAAGDRGQGVSRGATSDSAQPRVLVYRFLPGQVLDYELTARTLLTQRVADATIPVDATVRGTLRLSVYEEDRDGFGLGVQLVSPRMFATMPTPSPGAAPVAAVDQGLAREVYLRVSKRGALLGLYLPEDMPVSDRNTLRGLVAPLAFILPGEVTVRWTAEQEDVLGRFQALYRLEDAAVSMSKQYSAAWSNGRLVPVEQSGLQVHAAWQARLHPAGFLQSLEGREQMRAEDAASSCSGTQDYTLAFASECRRVLGAFPPRRSAFFARFNDCRSEVAVGGRAAPARAFPGESLDRVLERVRRVSSDATSGDVRSLLLLDLRALCQQDARAARRVLESLDQGSCDESSLQILAMALATSGQAQAEEGLRHLALQAGGVLRETAVEALGFVAAPQPDTVQALDELARSRSDSGEIRRLALQSLGLLGASEDASPALRQLAGLKLLPLQPRPGEDAAPWLLAMQNATPENGERACAEVYDRGGEGVRVQALQVMARYQTAAAREALRLAADRDPSEAVRKKAQALLGGSS